MPYVVISIAVLACLAFAALAVKVIRWAIKRVSSDCNVERRRDADMGDY